ncbi:MAG TPA: TetR/AcrR family transcriptional regulator [Candidatus Limiplasma sp.]|nr:TetR/AcrR family transcriptional regulator [Candidatus Limiplasma sp.]HPS80635.1 TetR/AcrR family transcriptional regulator [Candidatus Limiplasma sp.]
MQSRQRIMDAALRLFSTLGYSGVTMERIAHESGVGKATLYRYFASKDELINACVESFSSALGASIEGVLNSPSLSPREKIAGFLSPVVRFVSGINPAALADLQRSAPEAYAQIELARRRLIFGNITRVISEGKAAGLFRKDVGSALVAHVLIGAISHLSRPEVMETLAMPLGAMLDQVLNLLWEGCWDHPDGSV